MAEVRNPDVLVEPAKRVIVSTFTGAVTLDHFMNARRALAALPGWDESFTHILDLGGVTDLALSPADVKVLVSAPPMFAKTAMQIVVASPGHDFGVARMFQLYAEGGRPNLHVVSSMVRARELCSLSTEAKDGTV